MLNKKNHISFGDLESEVMEVLWCEKESTVREVVQKLKTKKAYTTIMTVMDRLYDKKILKRKKSESGAYVYVPAICKESFCQQISKKIIKNLIAEFGEVAIANFVDIMEENDSEKIKEWKKKLMMVK